MFPVTGVSKIKSVAIASRAKSMFQANKNSKDTQIFNDVKTFKKFTQLDVSDSILENEELLEVEGLSDRFKTNI